MQHTFHINNDKIVDNLTVLKTGKLPVVETLGFPSCGSISALKMGDVCDLYFADGDEWHQLTSENSDAGLPDALAINNNTGGNDISVDTGDKIVGDAELTLEATGPIVLTTTDATASAVTINATTGGVDINTPSVTISGTASAATPTLPAHLTTKGYVDGLIGTSSTSGILLMPHAGFSAPLQLYYRLIKMGAIVQFMFRIPGATATVTADDPLISTTGLPAGYIPRFWPPQTINSSSSCWINNNAGPITSYIECASFIDSSGIVSIYQKYPDTVNDPVIIPNRVTGIAGQSLEILPFYGTYESE